MTMRPDEWARVKSLFEAASAIAALRRAIQNGYWHVDVLQSDRTTTAVATSPNSSGCWSGNLAGWHLQGSDAFHIGGLR
jgi:hypothetical protein